MVLLRQRNNANVDASNQFSFYCHQGAAITMVSGDYPTSHLIYYLRMQRR